MNKPVIEKGETIKDIPGYEKLYAITNKGRVWSYPKNGRGKSKHDGKWLTPVMNNHGYFTIMFCKNRKQKRYCIHRLISINFIPNPKNKPEVNHINGIKTDNRLCNLEWVTRSENIKHAWRIGLNKVTEKMMLSRKITGSKTGRKNGLRNRKLTMGQAGEIRELYMDGLLNQFQLADNYGISQQTISNIITKNGYCLVS